MVEDGDNKFDDRLAKVIQDSMAYAANETRLLAEFEEFFSPRPATLCDSEEKEKALYLRIHGITKTLGGPPIIIVKRDNEPSPRYDTYPAAVFHEAISVFLAARKAVCRAYMLEIGIAAIRRFPEMVNTEDDHIRSLFLSNAEDAFWEHAENGFVKLCSYWDRVGQVLDFIFFRIRQFERDGFTAVMDRIAANFLPVYEDIRNSLAWKSLDNYRKSEQEDGLKWLLRRRNLVIHSLHLRPIQTEPEERIFESAYNHLEEKLRQKLKPGTPQQEVKRLHAHLRAAAELFPHVLTFCEQAVRSSNP
jgi:hypothetical protein